MKKFQRIGAVTVIVILLSMYIVCLVAAFIGSETAQIVFRAALGLTIALPILLYIFILFLKASEKRRNEFAAPPEELPSDVPESGSGSGPDAS